MQVDRYNGPKTVVVVVVVSSSQSIDKYASERCLEFVL